MKKIALYLMTTCLLLIFQLTQSNSAIASKSSFVAVSQLNNSKEVKEKALLLRLDEINAMDKSNLIPSDKKILRNEVLSISKQLKMDGGGVIYISGGALLVIILLLIILL